MHVLHFFSRCSQTLTIFPKTCQNTHFVAVLKRSPSRFSVFEGTKYRQIAWCSHMFIMIQTHFSCSHVYTLILPKFWEHAKIIWSMMSFVDLLLPISYHAPKIFITLPRFRVFFCEFDSNFGSMKKTFGAWRLFFCLYSQSIIMLQNYLSCSHVLAIFGSFFGNTPK